jgi:hypothetical protein
VAEDTAKVVTPLAIDPFSVVEKPVYEPRFWLSVNVVLFTNAEIVHSLFVHVGDDPAMKMWSPDTVDRGKKVEAPPRFETRVTVVPLIETVPLKLVNSSAVIFGLPHGPNGG